MPRTDRAADNAQRRERYARDPAHRSRKQLQSLEYRRDTYEHAPRAFHVEPDGRHLMKADHAARLALLTPWQLRTLERRGVLPPLERRGGRKERVMAVHQALLLLAASVMTRRSMHKRLDYAFDLATMQEALAYFWTRPREAMAFALQLLDDEQGIDQAVAGYMKATRGRGFQEAHDAWKSWNARREADPGAQPTQDEIKAIKAYHEKN